MGDVRVLQGRGAAMQSPLYYALSSGSYSACQHRQAPSQDLLKHVAVDAASGTALGMAVGQYFGPASAVAVPAMRSAMQQGHKMDVKAECAKVAGNVLLSSGTAWLFGSQVIVPAVVFGASAYALDSAVDRY